MTVDKNTRYASNLNNNWTRCAQPSATEQNFCRTVPLACVFVNRCDTTRLRCATNHCLKRECTPYGEDWSRRSPSVKRVCLTQSGPRTEPGAVWSHTPATTRGLARVTQPPFCVSFSLHISCCCTYHLVGLAWIEEHVWRLVFVRHVTPLECQQTATRSPWSTFLCSLRYARGPKRIWKSCWHLEKTLVSRAVENDFLSLN